MLRKRRSRGWRALDRPRAASFLAGAFAGATAAYLVDPRLGRRRRRLVRDRTMGRLRRAVRRTVRAEHGAFAWLRGRRARLAHLHEEPKLLTDETLAQKVMSEVFRDPALPKGRVNVNVEDGTVVLRGELDEERLIEHLIERTRRVAGVRGVDSRLHLSSWS